MATVIQAPLVKKDVRRELTRETPRAQSSGAERSAASGGDAFDPTYVEQLNRERMQALSRVEELEEQLQAMNGDKDRIHEEAKNRGYEKGFLEAQAQHAQKLDAEWQSICALTGNLSEQRETLLRESEDAAIEIAYAALIKILGRSRADISLVSAMVKQAVRQVSARDGLVVHVSPEDYERLERHVAASKGKSAWPADVGFQADDEVSYGGCIVKSRSGALDARLNYQLRQLKSLFLKARRAESRAPRDASPKGELS